jgi:demethylmenaquinone methyltransferase/2-methoxy-6-polyprenyl-1,4-benzoquinol methylase
MRNLTGGVDFRNKIDFYTLIAPFYDGLVGPFLRAVRKGISMEAKGDGCRRVLEVACGTGEQATMLARAGLDVTGVDLSGAMLEVARVKSPPAVSYVLANAENLPFGPEAFDCVSVSLSLHEMEYHARIGVAVEMLRVLAPRGKLIVFDYAAMEKTKFALAPGFLGLLERIAGTEHFANFVRFTRMGGVGHFLRAFPLRIVTTRSYFLGALELIIAEKSP